MTAFLRVNGCRLEFNDLEACSFLIGLYLWARLCTNTTEKADPAWRSAMNA